MTSREGLGCQDVRVDVVRRDKKRQGIVNSERSYDELND